MGVFTSSLRKVPNLNNGNDQKRALFKDMKYCIFLCISFDTKQLIEIY